jgi:glycosyltransferase involved in cell wall biosynthesis
VVGFIVPSLEGPTTGGTLFNRMLTTSLQEIGIRCAVSSTMPAAIEHDAVWVDSLFLDQMPALARLTRGVSCLGLLLHYLPSLVEHGAELTASTLSSLEGEALAAADRILVPSPFLRTVVERLLDAPPPIIEIEPGRLATRVACLPDPPVRAVLVANLLPGKGVLPLLSSLAGRARASDRFLLDIVGTDALDGSYAEQCREAVGSASLRGRVRLYGPLSPEATVEHMAQRNLLLSASTMESYGMALAEARGVGLPILAQAGGNVEALVGRESGGEVVPDASELAERFLALCREPAEHCARIARARAKALPPRPWSVVADELARKTRIEPDVMAIPASRVSNHG